MLQGFYAGLIQLHPAAFRARFGDEMLEIFDHASGWNQRFPLMADGILSLVRQWLLRPEFRRTMIAVAEVPALRMTEPYKLNRLALFHGVLLSVLSLTAIVGMMGDGGKASAFPVRARPSPFRPQVVAFDAISIRRSPAAQMQRASMEFLPGGRFRATSTPMFLVLATAYDIPWQSLELAMKRIKGSPDWMMGESYDISAVSRPAAPGTSSKARNDRIRLMLQNLLADRLKLRVRRDLTETESYALTLGKTGPRMEKSRISEQACTESAPFAPLSGSTPGCHQFQGGIGRGLRAVAADMSDLAKYVSNWSDLPVVNQTGLEGLYEIQTEGWRASGTEGSQPDLGEVLDRLGLKLTRKKARLEVLTIEHVEKPSEN